MSMKMVMMRAVLEDDDVEKGTMIMMMPAVQTEEGGKLRMLEAYLGVHKRKKGYSWYLEMIYDIQ